MTATLSQSLVLPSGRRSVSQAVLRLGTMLTILLGITLGSVQARAATPVAVAAQATRQLDGKVNINTATADQLRLLPGVGPATAAKILAYRIRHPFGHVSHLLRISGIGRKTYDAIRRYITVEGETTLHVPADP